MFTRCTQCDTAFRIEPEDLAMAAGEVRCGRCGATFNALLNLSNQPPDSKDNDRADDDDKRSAVLHDEATGQFDQAQAVPIEAEPAEQSATGKQPPAPDERAPRSAVEDGIEFLTADEVRAIAANAKPAATTVLDNEPQITVEEDTSEDEPEITVEEHRPGDEPYITFEQDSAHDEPEITVEEEGPGDEPEITAEEDHPDDEPEITVEEDGPDDEPYITFEQDSAHDEPEITVEEDGPGDDLEITVEQDTPDDEPEITDEEDRPDEEPKITVEDSNPDDEPEVTAEEESPDDEPEATVEEESPDDEPEATVEEDGPGDEPEVTAEKSTPDDEPDVSEDEATAQDEPDPADEDSDTPEDEQDTDDGDNGNAEPSDEDQLEPETAHTSDEQEAETDAAATAAAADAAAPHIRDNDAVDDHDARDLSAYLAPQANKGKLVAMTLVGLVLAGFLVAQLVHHFRAQLATHPVLGESIMSVYDRLGIRLIPDWDADAFDVEGNADIVHFSSVGNNGEAIDGLRVSAIIVNNATGARPAPVVKLRLRNRWGETVAARDFTPVDYRDSTATLAAGEKFLLELKLADPGDDVVGFDIDLCLPGANGLLRCARDAGN